MGSEIAMQRMSRLADHVSVTAENVDNPHKQLFPANCSSMENFTHPRRDNRMFYARQGSASQGRFMRQVSITQAAKKETCNVENSPKKCNYQKTGDEPMFSRPSPILATPKIPEYHQNTAENSSDPPKFARPGVDKANIQFNQITESPTPHGPPPRMDIAETTNFHIVTLEVPGANIMDTKVEIDDNNLTVTGKRSYPRWKTGTTKARTTINVYQRQILQGPYKVVWPLPRNVNKDSVSAELLNGYLRIILPKIMEKKSRI